MKKLITMLLVLVMAVSVFAGCNKSQTGAAANGPANALEILENVWAKYADDQKFSAMGGDMANPVMDAPGTYSMDEVENLPYTLYIPEAELKNIDGAATLVHAMMANNFTSGAVHMVDGVDAKAFCATMKDTLLETQWICGTPEEMLIATVAGNYVVIAFGAADLVATFKTNFTAAYANAEVLYSEAMVF